MVEMNYMKLEKLVNIKPSNFDGITLLLPVFPFVSFLVLYQLLPVSPFLSEPADRWDYSPPSRLPLYLRAWSFLCSFPCLLFSQNLQIDEILLILPVSPFLSRLADRSVMRDSGLKGRG